MRFWRDFRPALFAVAPTVAALLSLAAGVMLLASGATPSVPERFIALYEVTPAALIEVSHFISSILGLVLVMLAFGLRARLDGAWGATIATVLIAAPLALLKGFVWEETAALIGISLVFLPFRGAFPRKAQLTRMEVTQVGCCLLPPSWRVPACWGSGPSAMPIMQASRFGRR